MRSLKVFVGILILLLSSRLIPHPPNFTSLIALSFYIPVFFGLRYMPLVLFSFAITDILIGFHNTLFFTWCSVVLIGLSSIYFTKNLLTRIFGSITGVMIFYIVTNFGVWTTGSYSYNVEGLVTCYILAIPFLGNNLVSTLMYSLIIETIYKFYQNKSGSFKKFSWYLKL